MFNNVFSVSKISVFFFMLVLPLRPGISFAEEAHLAERFSMVMEPPATSIAIEQGELQAITDFFHQAERAIESENIDLLMTLYSDQYTNLRNRDKDSARALWSRIFAGFDNISSRHSMEVVAYDKGLGQAITQCSGLLTGTPRGENQTVTIDRWDHQLHILVKQGNWKLFGNSGKSTMRYGEEDGKLHPLF